MRASALRQVQAPGDIALPGQVELAEISGSDTLVHVATAAGELVGQLTGVHYFALGSNLTLYLTPLDVYVFADDGALLLAPDRGRPRSQSGGRVSDRPLDWEGR